MQNAFWNTDTYYGKAGRMKIWQVIVKYPSKTISIPNIFGEMVLHGFQNSITFK